MPKITCYQCHQSFTDLEPFCPHCGAVRKENVMQKTIRISRRAVIGGGLGGGIGLLCGFVLGIVFHIVKRQPEGFRFDTFWTMGLIGFVIGGALGAAVVVVRDMVREE